MSRLKLIVLVAAICSFLVAIATPIIFHMGVGLGNGVAMSKYREFDLNGVINHERLKQFQDGRFSGDWTTVPEYLMEGENGWLGLGWWITCFWAIIPHSPVDETISGWRD